MFGLEHTEDEYESWGFLAALDGIACVDEVLRRYLPGPRRRLVMGSRYGGYVAQLMGKIAPATFTAVIDNAGYCRSYLNHIAGHEMIEADVRLVVEEDNGGKSFTFQAFFNNPWTIEDEKSPNYFADSHRAIRSLSQPTHRESSNTWYYIRQTIEDSIVPVVEKDRYVDLLKKFNPVCYNRTEKEPLIDMGDLFEKALLAGPDHLSRTSDQTDFSLAKTRRFVCCDKEYIFDFSPKGGLSVNVVASTTVGA